MVILSPDSKNTENRIIGSNIKLCDSKLHVTEKESVDSMLKSQKNMKRDKAKNVKRYHTKKRKIDDEKADNFQSINNKEFLEKIIYTYSVNNFSFSLTEEDMACLKPTFYLNDNIINFYMQYIYYSIMSDEQRESTYIFNCLFNTKLLGNKEQEKTDTSETRHARVAKWTKNVDLFDKDYLIFPVCEQNHWFLVIVCYSWMSGLIDYNKLLTSNYKSEPLPRNVSKWALIDRVERASHIRKERNIKCSPCILIMDPLAYPNRKVKVDAIRDYLQSEWNAKCAESRGSLIFTKRTIRGFAPKLPTQDNFTDCGLYVLHYTEKFFKKPICDFSVEYFKDYMKTWFRITDVKKKRSEIIEIITTKCTKTVLKKTVDSDTDDDDLKII